MPLAPPADAWLTAVPGTVVGAVAVGLLAGFVPLDVPADLVSIGTLVAFATVSIGVMVLRRTAPELPRGFRVPGYPVVPVLSIAACIHLVSGLSWIRSSCSRCGSRRRSRPGCSTGRGAPGSRPAIPGR